MRRWRVAIAMVGFFAAGVTAQEPIANSTARCDSIVASQRLDSVRTGLFFTASRVDDFDLAPGQAQVIATAVATSFMLPMPFRVRVFAGPAQMRMLMRQRRDTSTSVRAPSITGVYRFTSTKAQAIAHVETMRASLVTDLDSAMIAAIREASIIKEVVDLPPGSDSMRVQVRISTDSGPGSRRATTLTFPRMPVVDAVPMRDNPAPIIPDSLRGDSPEEVLLRFVVGPSGMPIAETVELARGRSAVLVRAAFQALVAQQFLPATIGGCPVSQVVYYPFSFGIAGEKTPPRH